MQTRLISPWSLPARRQDPPPVLPEPRTSRPPLTVDPPMTARKAAGLLRYLATYLGVKGLRYRAAPAPVSDGWETLLYGFQLPRHPQLPPEFKRPLILRVYASPQGLPRARREVAIQRALRRQGFPVPQVLLF